MLVCVNGFFIGVEVKAKNGKPSELQLYNIVNIRDAGGFAFVLYPSGFEEFKAFVEELKLGYYPDTRDMKIIFK